MLLLSSMMSVFPVENDVELPHCSHCRCTAVVLTTTIGCWCVDGGDVEGHCSEGAPQSSSLSQINSTRLCTEGKREDRKRGCFERGAAAKKVEEGDSTAAARRETAEPRLQTTTTASGTAARKELMLLLDEQHKAVDDVVDGAVFAVVLMFRLCCSSLLFVVVVVDVAGVVAVLLSFPLRVVVAVVAVVVAVVVSVVNVSCRCLLLLSVVAICCGCLLLLVLSLVGVSVVVGWCCRRSVLFLVGVVGSTKRRGFPR